MQNLFSTDGRLTPVENLQHSSTLLPFTVHPGIFSARTSGNIEQVTQAAFSVSMNQYTSRLAAKYPKSAEVLDSAGIDLHTSPTTNIFIAKCFEPQLAEQLAQSARETGIIALQGDNFSNVRMHCHLSALMAEALCKAIWPQGNVNTQSIVEAVLLHDADKRIERDRQKLKEGLEQLVLHQPDLAREIWLGLERKAPELVDAIRNPIAEQSYRIVERFADEIFSITPEVARQIVLGATLTGPNAHATLVHTLPSGSIALDVSDITKVIIRACDDFVSGPNFGSSTGYVLRPGERALLSGFGTLPSHRWMKTDRIVSAHDGSVKRVSSTDAESYKVSYLAGDFTQSMNDAVASHLKSAILASNGAPEIDASLDPSTFLVAITQQYIKGFVLD